jgi:hypothetical protein
MGYASRRHKAITKSLSDTQTRHEAITFNQKAEHAQQAKIDQLMVQHQNSDSPL